MNKHMEAIMACIEGLRNLDNWPESEAKTGLIYLRKALHSAKSLNTKFTHIHTPYADPLGNPISLFEWSVAKESIESHVRVTHFPNQIHISTVWTGANGYLSEHIKVFETMVFGIDDDENLRGYQERYGSYKEANIGHDKAVFLVVDYLEKKGIKPVNEEVLS